METQELPLLPNTDWNAEWMALQQARKDVSDVAFWDAHARQFPKRTKPSVYVPAFLRLLDLRIGESVFDMGCGMGAIALPLAKAGHAVCAADFSSAMLDQLRADAKREGVSERIRTINMSWEDNWDSHGVAPKSADVCIASRSIAINDMRRAFLKLSQVARSRVCITLATETSPRIASDILQELGVRPRFGKSYQYALNILINEGLSPTLRYIDSDRDNTFADVGEARAAFTRMIDDAAGTHLCGAERARVLTRLDAWLDENLEENDEEGLPDKKGRPQKGLRLTRDRRIRWAFISWEV